MRFENVHIKYPHLCSIYFHQGYMLKIHEFHSVLTYYQLVDRRIDEVAIKNIWSLKAENDLSLYLSIMLPTRTGLPTNTVVLSGSMKPKNRILI